jgi:hypothetical protein
VAIDYSAITEAVRAWVRDSLSLPDGKVILQDQTGQELTPPYATVRISTSSKPFGTDFADSVTDLARAQGQEVELSTTGPRNILAAINVYTLGAFGGAGATAMLANARDRLELDSVVAAFGAAGVAVVDTSDVQNLSALLETNFQGRAHLELTLGASSSDSERVGFIETISGTGSITTRPGDPSPTSIPFSADLTP